MNPIDRPLKLGELLAQTVQIYSDRIWSAIGLGAILACSFVLAALSGTPVVAIAFTSLAFAGTAAAAARLTFGDRFSEAWARALHRLPVLLALTVVVWVPFPVALSAPLLLVVIAPWLALVGFSIPIAMLDEEAPPGGYALLVYALQNSITIARAAFIHAFGSVAALLIVYSLIGNLLALVLVGFAENGGRAAFLLVQIVLGPFFLLGLSVLYFEQKARALSSPRQRS